MPTKELSACHWMASSKAGMARTDVRPYHLCTQMLAPVSKLHVLICLAAGLACAPLVQGCRRSAPETLPEKHSIRLIWGPGSHCRDESLNAFVACGHWKHGHAAVFLICDSCGSAGELHASDSVKKLTQDVESVKFKMRNAVIEVRGLCADCS